MTEQNILELYFKRDGNAIYETDLKYGNYCYTVAYNILSDNEDSEESVNDTYLETWNRIPPTRPNSLKAYLGKICRHISISRSRHNATRKRGGNEVVTITSMLQREVLDIAPQFYCRLVRSSVLSSAFRLFRRDSIKIF